MVDLDGLMEPNEAKDMEFGNRMAVLSGDFLLANACTGLAQLHNTEVVSMISKVIGDLMEAEAMANHFTLDDLTFEHWRDLVFKRKGSLIANSCKAALKLVGHEDKVSKYNASSYVAGHDKTPVRLARASEFLCRASRSPWQLAHWASKVEPETIKTYERNLVTSHYDTSSLSEDYCLSFIVHNKGEMAHRRKKSGQVRINSRQVDLSRSLPQEQAENFFFVTP